MGNDKELRSGLIRLASEKPEIRKEILAVLKKTAGTYDMLALIDPNTDKVLAVESDAKKLRDEISYLGLQFKKDPNNFMGGTWSKGSTTYEVRSVPLRTSVGQTVRKQASDLRKTADADDVHTVEGKQQFIRSFMESLEKSALKDVAKFPDEFDGWHIRAYLGELMGHEFDKKDPALKRALKELLKSGTYYKLTF